MDIILGVVEYMHNNTALHHNGSTTKDAELFSALGKSQTSHCVNYISELYKLYYILSTSIID